jgi:hypothetical protein
MTKQTVLCVLFFSYFIALRAQAPAEEEIVIKTLDSLELPCPNKKMVSHLQFSDTAIYFLLRNSATLYTYSLAKKEIVDSLSLLASIPYSPPSNNFYYLSACNLLKKEIPVFFKVTPNWVYTENNLGFSLWNRKGKLLGKGFFRAPRKGKARYTAEPQASFYSVLLGNSVYKPIVRGRPRYEKRDKKKLPPFHFEKDYYKSSNYVLARYRLKLDSSARIKERSQVRFKKHKAQLACQSNFDFVKFSYAHYLYHTHVAIDEADGKLLVGFESDPQIIVTDENGNTLKVLGEKGKHIPKNEELNAIPAELIHQIEKRPFYRNAPENRDLALSLERLTQFSARYKTLFWDSYQKYVFRWYEFPTPNPYFQPPFTDGQFIKSYGLQVYDAEGKLTADLQIKSPFKFLYANPDATYWALMNKSYENEDCLKLYRIRLNLE